MKIMREDHDAWYRQPAMIVVAGVLAATFVGSAAVVGLAVTSDDPLVISEADYERVRAEFRVNADHTEEGDGDD